MDSIRLIDCNEYFSDLLSLADVSFGKSYLTEVDFLSKGTFVWAAFREARLIGFLLSYEVDRKLFLQHDYFNVVNTEAPVVHIKSIAVLPQMRLQGVATALLTSCLAHFRCMGIEFLFTELWMKGSSIAAAKIVERAGFVELKQLHHFWYNDSLSRGYICEECGAPPCCCHAVLYGLSCKGNC